MRRPGSIDSWPATLAFGHTGFLVFEGGFENAVRSYYSRATDPLTLCAAVGGCRFVMAMDKATCWRRARRWPAAQYRRSQVATRYADGLEVFVNGHPTEAWSLPQITLPPNGWYVKGDGAKSLLAYSALQDGRRVDYVDSPAYVYANGSGQLTRFPAAVARGQLVARRLDNQRWSCLGSAGAGTRRGDGGPVSNGHRLGRSRPDAATSRDSLQPRAGLCGACAGRSQLSPDDHTGTGPTLSCEQTNVIPGETVHLEPGGQQWQVPADTPVGSQVWFTADGRWLDFTVVPLVTPTLSVTEDAYELRLSPHLAQETKAVVQLGAHRAT